MRGTVVSLNSSKTWAFKLVFSSSHRSFILFLMWANSNDQVVRTCYHEVIISEESSRKLSLRRNILVISQDDVPTSPYTRTRSLKMFNWPILFRNRYLEHQDVAFLFGRVDLQFPYCGYTAPFSTFVAWITFICVSLHTRKRKLKVQCRVLFFYLDFLLSLSYIYIISNFL